MTVSRRGLLLGSLGSGLVLAGCGTNPGPPPAPTAAPLDRLVEGAFFSHRMQRSIGYALAYPPGRAVGDRLPLVVTLHGRRGDHRNAIRSLRLHQVLDQVRAPFALASVDGGDHSYYHPRADGTDAGAMVVEELLPALGERHLDVGTVGLHGWSMGGYGALLLAGQHPERFRAVAVSSPALFRSAAVTSPNSFDGPADFARHDVLAHPEWLRGQRIRVDCGRADPFFGATQDFAKRLPGVVSEFPEGGHRPAYWRRMATPAFRFLAEALTG